MCDPFINFLYSVGGIIIGIIIGYKFRIFWYKRTKFIDACIQFRDAFAWFLNWLDYDAIKGSERVSGKLQETEISKRHEGAINSFRHFLSGSRKIEFNEACKKFYNDKNNRKYDGYSGLDTSPERNESRNLARNNINGLLDFAKY